MANNVCSLVIMAAGMGSRFGGGIKQLEPVGPAGELIIDYSIHDAVKAGFKRLVIVLREDIKNAFDERIGRRAEEFCAHYGVEVKYVFQKLNDLPAGYSVPNDHAKPWGTAHVLYACREVLDGPFAVINADDFYGADAFQKTYNFLASLPFGSRRDYCLAGFFVENTLSENGSVTRGVCKVSDTGELLKITETPSIIKTAGGAAAQTDKGLKEIPCGTPVSMNMWGFSPDIIGVICREFEEFLNQNAQNNKAEFLIPTLIGSLIQTGEARAQVLPTGGRWYGMTYSEDVPAVRAAISKMVESGLYNKGILDIDDRY